MPLPTSTDRLAENLLAVMRLRGRLADLDLIHAWHARGFELGLWLARRLGIPATGTLHDHPRAAFHGRCRQFLMRRSSAGFRRLVCVSQAVSDACGACGYACPLTVIRNGLMPAPDRPARGGGPVRIGFLGMYTEWKGFSIVADWARQSADLGVHWHLYGPIAAELQARADATQRTAPGLVRLEGRQPTEQIFATIDILVAPSTQFDPLPTVLIEAARAGIPCVAANAGGAGEIVEHLRTGFIFSVAEPAVGLQYLRRLVEDAALRQTMGRAARQRFERSFGVANMVSAYADFWRAGVREGE